MVLYYLIPRKSRNLLTISAIFAAIILNGLLSYINDTLGFPIFLDSVFTVMTAALFGFWPSVVVGLLTNSFIELLNGFPGIYYPFTIVNIITALTASFFIHKNKFESATNAFWLILVLAIVNSLSGALIVTLVFGGYTNLSLDNIVRGIMVTGKSLLTSAFYVRLIVNIVDKGIAVLISFFLYKFVQLKSSAKK